jgi:hypothetical protein
MKEGRDRSHLAGIAVGCAVLLVGVLAMLATEPASFQVASNDPLAAGALAWPGRTSGSIERQTNP